MKNKMRMRSYCLTFILLFGLVGCSNNSNNTTGIKTEDQEKASVKEISDQNKVLNVGEIVSITLDENISTGYSWYYSIENPDLIKFESENNQDNKPNMPGAGSKHTWDFKVVKQGATKITFKYYQSWVGESSGDKTVVYNININQ